MNSQMYLQGNLSAFLAKLSRHCPSTCLMDL